MSVRRLLSYPVWDVATRWFHWINFVCVVSLIAIGHRLTDGLGVSGIVLLPLDIGLHVE
jgi:Ni,Fe-hydrogenase I cytochrome b subunit